MTVGPIRTRHRRAETTVSTLPYRAPGSVSADLDLSKLRERLPMLSQAAAVKEVLRYQSEALARLECKEDRVIRLAQILEKCNYGEKASCVADHTVNINFWSKAMTARAALEKKRNSAEKIQIAFPSDIFVYYKWHDLGQTAWRPATVEFNRQMLRRDKEIRLLRLTRPYIGQLIGEHHAMSKILDAHSPLETQDIYKAWEIMRKWPYGKAAHRDWEWSQQETMAYLRKHHLGFDKHGIIVSGAGQLDDKLLKPYLYTVSKASDATRSDHRSQASDSCNHTNVASPPSNKSLEHAGSLTAETPSLQSNRATRSHLNPEDATSSSETHGKSQDNGQPKSSDVTGNARSRSPGLSRHTFSNHVPHSLRRQEVWTGQVSRVESQVTPSCSASHEDDGSPIWLHVQQKILEAVELVRTPSKDVDDAKRQEIESLLRTALAALDQH